MDIYWERKFDQRCEDQVSIPSAIALDYAVALMEIETKSQAISRCLSHGLRRNLRDLETQYSNLFHLVQQGYYRQGVFDGMNLVLTEVLSERNGEEGDLSK